MVLAVLDEKVVSCVLSMSCPHVIEQCMPSHPDPPGGTEGVVWFAVA